MALANPHFSQNSNQTAADELLEQGMIEYYLNHLHECHVNVTRGLAILNEMEENEREIIEAVCLRSRTFSEESFARENQHEYSMLRDLEDCESEKRAMARERRFLQEYLYRENHKLVLLEGSIFALREPIRSVIVCKYMDLQSWPSIQKKVKRSASRVFQIHREGLDMVKKSIRSIALALDDST